MKAVKAVRPARMVALLGLLAALALIFSYVELLIPFSFGIPGIKLGLANVVIVVSLYTLSGRQTLLLDLVKILVSSLLFGNAMVLMYSLAGGMLSLFLMWLAKRSGRLGVAGVSVLGGVSHNIGQLAVAVAVTETLKLSYYLPILVISGLVTGLLIGITADRVIPLLRKALIR